MNLPRPVHGGFNEILDFIVQSRKPKPRAATPAGGVNTLGETPDSEWFTNRHGRRRLSRRQLQQGPPGKAPQPPFTIVKAKAKGIMPGFEMVDAQGRRYFSKLDPERDPELASAAEVIVSKILYAIGYNTPSNHVVRLKLSDLRLSGDATMKRSDGRSKTMTWSDVKELVDQVYHYPDGSFRMVASLAIDGEIIGPFRYESTRRDDPNDIVPHENRRDLRGLYVFSAWLNNTDARAANTLDTIVKENGSRFIRHYLLDFGSALGSNGDRPKSARAGHRFMLPSPVEALKRILTVGAVPEPWERMSYPHLLGVGNFTSHLFDPDSWKSNSPNPAFLSRLSDDDYWAAKLVMAFSDDDIRAIVETARYSDTRSTEYIIATLISRRDQVGRTFFSRVLPLDQFRIENGQLQFEDLAVKYGFHNSRQYQVRWSRFDNIQYTHVSLSLRSSRQLPSQAVNAPAGSYFAATIRAVADPRPSLTIYFRKQVNGYKLVGIDRLW